MVRMEETDIYVLATKGFLDATFSSEFPSEFEELTKQEIKRVLKQFH